MRAARAILLLCLAAAGLADPGCGKKGPPLAPRARVPGRASDIAVRGTGDVVAITFTIPSANIDESKPADIGRVDVYAVTAMAPADVRDPRRMTLVGSVAVRKPREPQDKKTQSKKEKEKGKESDLAGFAASTYLRGINWVAIPTTLLGMVDASIGGKTGINLKYGKNLVGSFFPPQFVLADVETLHTLPKAEISSGMAEVIKAGIIGDSRLLTLCEEGLYRFKENTTALVSRAMAVKAKVIQADPYEKGLRAVLNLGHTIGHAIELESGYRLKHGEAIAIGMLAETELSAAIGLAYISLARRVKDVLAAWELPVIIPENTRVQDILQAMKVDKKRQGGEVRFALPVDIGNVKYGVKVSMEHVREYLLSVGVEE